MFICVIYNSVSGNIPILSVEAVTNWSNLNGAVLVILYPLIHEHVYILWLAAWNLLNFDNFH